MTVEELSKQLDKNFELNNQVLDEKFKNVHSELRIIKEQTIKTNGRVTKLEESSSNEKMFHLNCPVKKEFDEFKVRMDDDLLLLKFARTYPRLTTVMFGILVTLIISGGLEGLLKVLGVN